MRSGDRVRRVRLMDEGGQGGGMGIMLWVCRRLLQDLLHRQERVPKCEPQGSRRVPTFPSLCVPRQGWSGGLSHQP